MVRVWNPYVPSKPTAVLDGHVMGVIDVAIHQQLGLAISLAKDNVSSYTTAYYDSSYRSAQCMIMSNSV